MSAHNIQRKSHGIAEIPRLFYWLRRQDLLFCGKATAVETVPRTVSKSRLSNPLILK